MIRGSVHGQAARLRITATGVTRMSHMNRRGFDKAAEGERFFDFQHQLVQLVGPASLVVAFWQALILAPNTLQNDADNIRDRAGQAYGPPFSQVVFLQMNAHKIPDDLFLGPGGDLQRAAAAQHQIRLHRLHPFELSGDIFRRDIGQEGEGTLDAIELKEGSDLFVQGQIRLKVKDGLRSLPRGGDGLQRTLAYKVPPTPVEAHHRRQRRRHKTIEAAEYGEIIHQRWRDGDQVRIRFLARRHRPGLDIGQGS